MGYEVTHFNKLILNQVKQEQNRNTKINVMIKHKRYGCVAKWHKPCKSSNSWL